MGPARAGTFGRGRDGSRLAAVTLEPLTGVDVGFVDGRPVTMRQPVVAEEKLAGVVWQARVLQAATAVATDREATLDEGGAFCWAASFVSACLALRLLLAEGVDLVGGGHLAELSSCDLREGPQGGAIILTERDLVAVEGVEDEIDLALGEHPEHRAGEHHVGEVHGSTVAEGAGLHPNSGRDEETAELASWPSWAQRTPPVSGQDGSRNEEPLGEVQHSLVLQPRLVSPPW